MGRAWIALSHAGVREIWLSATTKLGSFASGTRAFWITSFALSWFSSVSKRARTEVPSTATRSAVRLAAARACSTRCATAVVDLDAALDRRNLHRRGFTKEIGQAVAGTHQQHDHQDRPLPDRISVHDRALTSRKAIGAGDAVAATPDKGWQRPPLPHPDFRFFTSPCPWAALAPRRCAGSALPRCWRFRCAGNLRTGA